MGARHFLLFAALLAAFAAPPVRAADDEATNLRAAYLEAEYGLAKKPALYAVFDLTAREIRLRGRGETFRVWPIRGIRVSGGNIPVAPLALEARRADDAPERAKIEPPPPPPTGPDGKPLPEEEWPPAPEPDPFEVTDMPSRYTLAFAEAVEVAVSPAAQGSLSFASRAVKALWRYVSLPVTLLVEHFGTKPRARVELTLDEADARSLYWALFEGTPALFWEEPTP